MAEEAKVELTDEVLADLETKARATLEDMGEPWRHQRWKVGNAASGVSADFLAVVVEWPDDPDFHHMLLEDQTDVLHRTTADHIAAADPLTVLSLVAEVRRLKLELEETRERVPLADRQRRVRDVLTGETFLTWSVKWSTDDRTALRVEEPTRRFPVGTIFTREEAAALPQVAPWGQRRDGTWVPVEVMS